MTHAAAVVAADGEQGFRRFGESVNPHLAGMLRRVGLDADFVRGEGALLYDAHGRELLDFVAGYGALPFGHNPPAVLEAVAAMMRSGAPLMVQPLMPAAAGALAERLLTIAPGPFGRVLFANSGAEAVEAALKACRMATGRDGVIAMRRGFHGKTMGAMGVTDMDGRGNWRGPEATRGSMAPFGDLDALERLLAREGSATAAVIVEPVQGEGGVHVASDDYLRGVRALCDAHGVLLVFDEVQTGLGRTGTLFAAEHSGVVADCVALSKGLGGGVLPIGACLVGERADGEMLAMQHSSTFAGNGLACAAALATLDLLQADGDALLGNVRARSEQLTRAHVRFAGRFPRSVAAHRGRGLLLGLELRARAADASWGRTLEALCDQGQLCVALASHLFNAEGVRVAPTLRAAGVLRVEPPLNVTAAQCDRYEQAMERTLAKLEAGDTAALLAHLGGAAPPAFPRAAPAARPVAARPAAADGRFGFLVHPLDPEGLGDFDAALRALGAGPLETLASGVLEMVEPFHAARRRFAGADGVTALGDFVVVPRTAAQMRRMERADAVALVQRAVDVAVEQGARIVGLGGFTSIVTAGGALLDGRGAGVTTGNSFTVASAMQAIEQAALRLGLPLDRLAGAVVGATGMIGGAAMTLLGARCGRLLMIGNPASAPAKTRRRMAGHMANALAAWLGGACPPRIGSAAEAVLRRTDCPMPDAGEAALHAFAQRLLDGAEPRLEVAPDCAALRRAHVAVVATSSTEAFIEPGMVSPGAVICDLSRPANISRDLARERPDVLVIDGGTIAFPNRPDFGFNFGLPRGIGYACMAEAAVLGLEGRYGHFSRGAHLDLAEVALVERLAARHGFALSGLRSMDRPLTRFDWRHLMAAAHAAAGADGERNAPRPEGAVAHPVSAEAAALPGSVGRDAPVDICDLLVGRHLAAGHGDRPAVVAADGAAASYAELDALSGRMAAGLAERGVGARSRVAVGGRDGAEMVAAFLAAWRLGASVVPLNPATAATDAAAMARAANACLAVDCGLDAVQALAWKDAGLESVPAAALADAAAAAPASRPRSADLGAVCLFTSGSTGTPKAVEHCVGDLVNINLNYAAAVLSLRRGDRVATTSRLFFAYGFNILQMTLWAGAAALLAPERFDAQSALARLERDRATLLFAVPTVYLLMLRSDGAAHDLRALRLCVSAGEPLPEDVFDGWRDRFGTAIMDGLGTSEALSTFLSCRPDDVLPGCTGRVMPGFAVRLVTEDGRLARPGEIGRLWVKGNTVAPGYLNGGPETRALFADGWCCTNDLLHHDAEGRFFYVGRANDMLKSGGVWTSPMEIERTLRGHPAVLDCAVVARAEVGLLARPEAFVVARLGVRPDAGLASELKRYARDRLLPGRAPHFVTFVDELPRTATQKVQRFKLRERPIARM